MKLPKRFFSVKLLHVLLILIPFVLSFFLIFYFGRFPVKQVSGVYSTDPPDSTDEPPPEADPCDGTCDASDPIECPSDCNGGGGPDPNCQYQDEDPLWCSDEDCGGGGDSQWYCQDPDPVECSSAAQCGGTCECGQNNTTASCSWACISGSCVMDCGPAPNGDDDGCNPTAPDAPTLNLPVNGSTFCPSGGVVLSWNEISNWGEDCVGNPIGDHNYAIWIGTASPPNTQYGWVNQGTTSFAVPFTFRNGTTYYWRVVSSNSSESNWSEIWSFTTVRCPPSAPTLNDVPSTPDECSDQADFSWTHNGVWGAWLPDPPPAPVTPQDNRFYVYYRKLGDSYSEACGDVASGQRACPAPTTLDEEGNYRWYVRASNHGDGFEPLTYTDSSVGAFSRWNSAPATPTLSSPGGTSPSNPYRLTATNDVTLVWQPNSDWGCNIFGNDDRFLVYMNSGPFPGSADPTNEICNNLSGYTTCGNDETRDLEWGSTYYWKVIASNGALDSDYDIFHFTPYVSAWWQTLGGDIHANAGGITSYLPSSTACTDPCKPYLMLDDLLTDQPGSAFWQSGSLELGDEVDYPGNISEGGEDWRAMVGNYLGTGYNYDFWKFNLGDEEDIGSFSSGNLPDPGETKIYEATGNLNIRGNIQARDSKVIILHDKGSGTRVRVTGDIEVEKESFLMVVTNGDLEVADNVDTLQGIFIADGTVSLGSGDIALDVQGLLTGWTNIDLTGRDFDDSSLNESQPIFTFTFRPDLLIEAPEVIRRPAYHWQEITP